MTLYKLHVPDLMSDVKMPTAGKTRFPCTVKDKHGNIKNVIMPEDMVDPPHHTAFNPWHKYKATAKPKGEINNA